MKVAVLEVSRVFPLSSESTYASILLARPAAIPGCALFFFPSTMASESAVRTAREFCGGALYDSNAVHARTSLADVPASDEGLKMLAANGNWSEVLALAEKLDARVTAKACRRPSRYSTVSATTPACLASSATTPASPLSTDAAVRNARLPYVLVQVTANLKLRRIVAARKVINELGDLEGEGFRHPVTRESFAPFSLRLIAASLPLYVGVPMEAQKKLYALLEECLRCERKCSEALHEAQVPGSSTANMLSAEAVRRLWCRWTQRVFRVQRALLHVHVHLNQQSLAHRIAEQVLGNEDVWHHTFHVLSDDLHQLRHVLHLQQVLCLALHVGDAQRAREVHRAIRQIAAELKAAEPTTAAPLSNSAFAMLITVSCDAFLAVFQGDYKEAVRLFCDVVDRCTEAKQLLKADNVSSDGDENLIAAADGTISELALRHWTLQELCANAQVSQATCMAYRSDAEPTKAMSSMCTTMEDYAKAEPHVLCNFDPFVESMVRFYTLAGERRANLERFSDLLEVFRCDRSSLPSLEALV